MTTKRQNFAVFYFLSRALFLGIGFSLILNITKQDSIIAFILGTLIGCFFIYLVNKINYYKKDLSLTEVLNQMKLPGLIIRIILLIYGIILFTNGIVFFQLFASSFLLSQSPLWFISLPIIVLVLLVSKKGITIAFRVAECLFPISFILTLLSLISLLPYNNFDNFLPLFVSKPWQLVCSTFYYAALSSAPGILMLISKKSHHNLKSYLLGSFTLITKIILILGIIGPTLAVVYRFPEYVILKEIKLLDFIEKIENIVGISWIIDNFVFIAVTSLFIKELLPTKIKESLHPLIIILIFIVSITIIGREYAYEVIMYYTIPIVLLIVMVTTVPLLFIHTYQKQKKLKKTTN